MCLEIAAKLLLIFRPQSVIIEHQDTALIQFRIDEPGWKLRTIILARHSLRALARDPQREIKIEYLQRDLLRAATCRTTFTYPHALRAGLA
ncbi:MAG TPA: hypothetical protein VM534_05710 [Thermoanaerobaculia bacterium]|nr:hypothetical protein [Thermoanaerobaculia bacterium]